MGLFDRNNKTTGPFNREFVIGQPVFLVILSMALCMSFVLSIFTAFPLVLLVLLNGRVRGLLMGLAGTMIMFLLGSRVMDAGPFLAWAYFMSFVLAFLMAEIFWRKWHPLSGFLGLGLGLVLLSGVFLASLSFTYEGGLQKLVQDRAQMISQEVLKNQSKYQAMKGEEYKEMVDFLQKPELISKDIMRSLASSVVLGIFLTLWVNLLMVLKAYRPFQLFGRTDYPYTEGHFLAFKVPDLVVWPLIAVLVMMYLGEQKVGVIPYVAAKNMFLIMGMFYFFQGLGVFLDVLTMLKVGGLFRPIIVMLTVVTSYPVLAAIGLFDMWVNFRNFIRKRIENKDRDSGEK